MPPQVATIPADEQTLRDLYGHLHTVHSRLRTLRREVVDRIALDEHVSPSELEYPSPWEPMSVQYEEVNDELFALGDPDGINALLEQTAAEADRLGPSVPPTRDKGEAGQHVVTVLMMQDQSPSPEKSHSDVEAAAESGVDSEASLNMTVAEPRRPTIWSADRVGELSVAGDVLGLWLERLAGVLPVAVACRVRG